MCDNFLQYYSYEFFNIQVNIHTFKDHDHAKKKKKISKKRVKNAC